MTIGKEQRKGGETTTTNEQLSRIVKKYGSRDAFQKAVHKTKSRRSTAKLVAAGLVGNSVLGGPRISFDRSAAAKKAAETKKRNKGQ